MASTRFPFVVSLLGAALLWNSAAVAQVPLPTKAETSPAGTLARIKETRSITLGVREAARPFSYLNEQKQPVGYTVDLCMAAVDEIRSHLKLPELKVKTVVVSGPERIPKLQAGEIDLECGSTTNTKARQEKVAFSYTVFVAGMRVATPKGLQINTVSDLQGLSVGLSKGTTSEKLFNQLNNGTKMQLVQFNSNAEAFKALREGKIKAFPQDDALLLGMASREKALDEVQLGDLTLSVEPYAIMARKDDDALLDLVDTALAKVYATGEINALHKKWFGPSAANIPMNRLTRDSFTRPNREAGVAMLIGYSL
jgi:glutamate/aspartate transport system substrate-binding protein